MHILFYWPHSSIAIVDFLPWKLIEVRDLSNSVVKTIKPPVQTNEIFYGGTASLILSSTTSVVLYDIQQQKTVAEVNSPPVKYVVWSADGSLVALMSKHSKLSFPFRLARGIRRLICFGSQRLPLPIGISRNIVLSMRLSVSNLALGMTLESSSTRL
jgi:hypothetical protein